MASGGMLGRLRQFDAYPKTMEDFRVKTFSGATITIVSGVIISLLFISELAFFLSTDVREELFVDTSRGEKLKINIDIDFPKMPCSYLSIDVMDVSGEHQFDLLHSLYKQRLDDRGNPIIDATVEKYQFEEKAQGGEGGEGGGGEERENIQESKDTKIAEQCQSCYGAETPERPCCNTCEEVREAYRSKGWAFKDHKTIAQCVDEGWTEKLQQQLNEGCSVKGSLEVSKVAGNFHFAPGKSFQQHSVHVHDLQTFGVKRFNLSHTIHRLSFGEDYPGIINPLDGLSQVANEQTPTGGTMYQYFVKIVPTVYKSLNKEPLKTNQFSVTRHQKLARAVAGEQGLPGVFFLYDLSPMMVQLTEHRHSLTHFLTGICAIVGGVFTVAGMVDGMLYHSTRALKKKIDLGKAS